MLMSLLRRRGCAGCSLLLPIDAGCRHLPILTSASAPPPRPALTRAAAHRFAPYASAPPSRNVSLRADAPPRHTATSASTPLGPSVDTSASAPTPTEQPISLVVTGKDVQAAKGKLRLDAFLSSRLPDLSRTKAQAAVNEGWVLLNGTVTTKAGAAAKAGDTVLVRALPEPPPLQAVPEDIPLDIVYEDDHLMVINKAAGMVVHISVGHHTGTLVNALLHHCGLPGLALDQLPAGSQHQQQEEEEALAAGAPDLLLPGPESEEDVDEELEVLGEGEDSGLAAAASTQLPGSFQQLPGSRVPGQPGVLRPGIVHRLDKGTSGLLVVAKQEGAHRALCAQFKDRSVGREYVGLCLGCLRPQQGRVETNIDRDPNDRKRMAALALGATRGRSAASNYWVMEELAAGGACLTRWKLDTGRTHQIRVHAKYTGHPLLGDDTYGGGAATAATFLARGRPTKQQAVRELVERLGRPALHARTLSFTHPSTGERLSFQVDPPQDFQEALLAVRQL